MALAQLKWHVKVTRSSENSQILYIVFFLGTQVLHTYFYIKKWKYFYKFGGDVVKIHTKTTYKVLKEN